MDRRDFPPDAWWTALDERRMKATVEDDEGEETEVDFVWAICGTCDGKGTHVNPAIDSHGIGADEWAEDWAEDERDGYMNGRYDVQCAECKGNRVVPDVAEDSPYRQTLDDRRRAEYTDRSMRAAGMRMGY